jgi:DNA-binding MarR family transcriptional regulator
MSSSALDDLLDEVRLLWHAMTRSAEGLHQGEPVTLGMRGVLEYLARHGPATVPTVARERHVTRQHIQTLVNALLSLDLVSLQQNPAHRRSALVHLTAAGAAMFERMKRRERRRLRELALSLPAGEVARAIETLRTVRKGLGGKS